MKTIEKRTPNLKVIFSKENLGYDKGINFAYSYLLDNQPSVDYIFLLNPDAIVEKNIIYNLYKILTDNPNAAAISPNIFDSTHTLQYAGWKVDWNKCTIDHNQKTDSVFTTDVFHGCAVLIDAQKFSEVGMFSDTIFMYYDEAFLSMKFTQHSYEILCANDYKVLHRSSYSLGKTSYLKSYYHTRNHLFFFNKYNTNPNIFCKYRYIIRNIFSSIRHLLFKNFLGMLGGTYDYWRGKSGKIQ